MNLIFTARQRINWEKQKAADFVMRGVKRRLGIKQRFRNERDYEPASAKYILVAPDVDQFLS